MKERGTLEVFLQLILAETNIQTAKKLPVSVLVLAEVRASGGGGDFVLSAILNLDQPV